MKKIKGALLPRSFPTKIILGRIKLTSKVKINGFGFDIELLSIAYLLKYSVREVPVSWYNSPVSRVRPIKDALRTFTELLYIKLNLMSGRYE